jgi:hypothetical protein
MPDGSGTQKLICALGLYKGNATDKKPLTRRFFDREHSKIKHSLQLGLSYRLKHLRA